MTPTDLPPARTLSRPGRHGLAMATGIVLVSVGVVVQVPDVLRMGRARSSSQGADMSRTGMSGTVMTVGMVLILVGLVLCAASIFRTAPRIGPRGDAPTDDAHLVIEHVRFRPLYAVTCLVLTIALVIDVMKPLTLGFVLPGLRREYGISLEGASVLPLFALSGTAVGSVIWGYLGDRYGRRSVLLLATTLFIATSACGAMPSVSWNLLMCFLMGASAGGLLPVVFTLVAELTPRSYRGWVAVSVGSVGGLGGYLAASNAARFLEPSYSWRALWLIGLPTGLMLLALCPFLPESPMYLVHSGRREQAEQTLARYGSRLVRSTDPQLVQPVGHTGQLNTRALLRRYPAATTVIGVTGVLWGVVNFGFMTLLPDLLRDSGRLGATGGTASALLANSALYTAPALVLVVLLYAGWSCRGALAFFFVAMGLSLTGVLLWVSLGHGAALLPVAIGGLVLSLTAINAMILPYSAEIYPTAMRATGAGFAGAATKLGGVLGPSAMLALLRLQSGLRLPALVLAITSLLGAALLIRLAPDVPGQARRSSRRATVAGQVERATAAD